MQLANHFICHFPNIEYMTFSIEVKENGTTHHYAVPVSGHDYQTDHYNPWTYNIKFDTVGQAISFKKELDALVWDSDDQFDVEELCEETSPMLYKKLGDCYQTYLHKREYNIHVVTAETHKLTDNDIRKGLIDEVLKEV